MDTTQQAHTSTFFNLPSAQTPSAGQVALLGVPFDGLSTERRGSCEAPGVLRRRSGELGRYSLSTGQMHHRDEAKAVDLGDLSLNRFDPQATFEPIRHRVSTIVGAGATPLIVGGDHSLTYGAVHAAAARHPNLRLIQIDAHHDATDPAEHGCRYNHGTFVRNLIDERIIAGADVFQLGVRDFQWSDSGATFLDQHGANIFALPETGDDQFAAFFAALDDKPAQPTWLTLDIDSVDPAFAPGTGEAMVGGLTAREILELLRRLCNGQTNLIGADLVELCPPQDIGERTAALAAQLLAIIFDGLI